MVRVTLSGLAAIEQVKVNNKASAKYEAKQRKQRLKEVTKNAIMLEKLIPLLPDGCELNLTSHWHYQSPEVSLPRELLPALRAAIGRLHVEGKSLVDAESRMLQVTLSAEQFPGVDFTYQRKLAYDSATCQIVEQTSTYKTLVCKRPE